MFENCHDAAEAWNGQNDPPRQVLLRQPVLEPAGRLIGARNIEMPQPNIALQTQVSAKARMVATRRDNKWAPQQPSCLVDAMGRAARACDLGAATTAGRGPMRQAN